MQNTTTRTLVLEYVDKNGASHIHEMHIEILQRRPNTPEHTIRARLSEVVAEGFLSRLGEGFYDIYAEEEKMTSVVSYPVRQNTCWFWRRISRKTKFRFSSQKNKFISCIISVIMLQ